MGNSYVGITDKASSLAKDRVLQMQKRLRKAAKGLSTEDSCILLMVKGIGDKTEGGAWGVNNPNHMVETIGTLDDLRVNLISGMWQLVRKAEGGT